MNTQYNYPSRKLEVRGGKNPTKTFIGGLVVGTVITIVAHALIISMILL